MYVRMSDKEITRDGLSEKERLSVLETSIDRTKVNKNSKFNKLFSWVNEWDWECHLLLLSAELYTREEAQILFNEYAKYDIDTKIWAIEFEYVVMRYFDEFESRAWSIRWSRSNDIIKCNFYKPVYYVEVFG